MNPAKSVYDVAAAISSRVSDGSNSSSVSGSTDPSKCRCSSARGVILAIIAFVPPPDEIQALAESEIKRLSKAAIATLSVFWAYTAWKFARGFREAKEASVILGDRAIPMTLVHPSGFFVAELRQSRRRISPAHRRLRIQRSLPFPSSAHFLRTAPARRGHQLRKLPHAGRAPREVRRRRRRALRRLGSQRRGGQRHRRFQSLGSHPPSHAPARRRHLGNFHSRPRPQARITNIPCSPAPARSRRSADPYALLRRRSRPRPRPSSGACRITPGPTRSGWKPAPAANRLREPVSIYEVHLESWMRGPNNEWLTYRELADKPGRVREARWATRIWNCCP